MAFSGMMLKTGQREASKSDSIQAELSFLEEHIRQLNIEISDSLAKASFILDNWSSEIQNLEGR